MQGQQPRLMKMDRFLCCKIGSQRSLNGPEHFFCTNSLSSSYYGNCERSKSLWCRRRSPVRGEDALSETAGLLNPLSPGPEQKACWRSETPSATLPFTGL